MPRRFASTTSGGTERAFENIKEQRTEQRPADSTPLVGPRDFQSRQTFPASNWARNNQVGEGWAANIVGTGTVDSAAAQSFDFVNHEGDENYGRWDIGARYYPDNNTADFAWSVPFQKFADYVRVGIRIYIATDCVGATVPSDVFDNVWLGVNQKGQAETKRDILNTTPSIAALDTWYYIYLAHNGTDISAWTGNPRAWVAAIAKRSEGEEPVNPHICTVFIEYLTVEQWNLYNTII